MQYLQLKLSFVSTLSKVVSPLYHPLYQYQDTLYQVYQISKIALLRDFKDSIIEISGYPPDTTVIRGY